ncbi:hypothetical protein M2459_000168 [Parabacteroides sp. PF5-5]|uniref:DUF4296 domain-containing protein n=1 Tax=unclassified Parabacteroides TaxID=2649774 RepID=UPI002476CFD8|nr:MULTISPECIES: DUF4296 domain-containing protein [unclassified Parabacteroides]MDH6303836.1 hypothetical protein [Parabacteroides sp. PH5-39]MDH6314453.1 hypothetical protein [Parabacteroides sp. PF5-13]MDH6318482.1 hypothetical protein [Parabacteroides sp. PH5-13]MDH6322225.1 hypothetical protein [Parabacteroides sp. PH5-8]MDH6325695.1 hypothetical protein [Parabacteroides sp. PH5-41]
MQKTLYRYSIAFIVTLLAISCSKVPKDVLSEKEMKDVMIDIYLAEGMINADPRTYPDSTHKAALYQSVFRKHKIEEAKYDSSLVWYGKNMDIYMQVMDLALAEINTRIRNLGDVQASAAPSSNKDSVNIWPRRDYLTLYPQALFNGVTFDIKPERPYTSGSVFVLGMRVWGLTEDMKHTPELRLAIDQTDTTLFIRDKILKEGYSELILRGLPTKQIRRVYGYIRLDNSETNYYKVFVDSLNLMKYNYDSPAIQLPADTMNTLKADSVPSNLIP